MGGTTSKPAAAEDSFKKKDPSKSSSDSQFTSLPPREKLPADLQKIVDDEDTLFEQIYDGKFVTVAPFKHATVINEPLV